MASEVRANPTNTKSLYSHACAPFMHNIKVASIKIILFAIMAAKNFNGPQAL